jgi:hypothetical protein
MGINTSNSHRPFGGFFVLSPRHIPPTIPPITLFGSAANKLVFGRWSTVSFWEMGNGGFVVIMCFEMACRRALQPTTHALQLPLPSL